MRRSAAPTRPEPRLLAFPIAMAVGLLIVWVRLIEIQVVRAPEIVARAQSDVTLTTSESGVRPFLRKVRDRLRNWVGER